MDRYPAHLEPGFTETGAVATPFADWWQRVHAHFDRVPVNVAEQWLHRHWGHSPYGFLSSSRYDFTSVLWDSERLSDILTWVDDWDPKATLQFGLGMLPMDFWLVRYMRQHRTFPEPIVVLDNRDHTLSSESAIPAGPTFPATFILVEGHRRHAIGLAMHSAGEFAREVPIWLMRGPPARA